MSWAPRRLSVWLLVLGSSIVWLYIFDRTVYGGTHADVIQSVVVDKIKKIRPASQVAGPDLVRLQTQRLEKPYDRKDFAVMGDRVATFAHLAELVTTPSEIDTLMGLLEQTFPWYEPGPSEYTPWSSQSNETGIVLCVGSETFMFAAHLITTLRKVLNSTLPIQIAYSGEDDLPKAKRLELTGLGHGIETLDLATHFNASLAELDSAGFGQKPFAMLASRFEHVILVDADILFLQKPDDVFETSPGLAESGTLFWHDRAKERQSDVPGLGRDWVQTIMGDKKPSRMLEDSLFWKYDLWGEMESGVVCMDKSRPNVFMTILFAAWMNTNAGGRAEVYSHTYGDKETYWVAAELASTPYYFEPDYAGNIGYFETDGEGRARVCGTKVAHTDSRRRPFWFNGSMRHNKNSGSSDMAVLSHWITGPVDWPVGPRWDYKAEGQWCMSEGTALALDESNYASTVHGLFHETKLVDQKYQDEIDRLYPAIPTEQLEDEGEPTVS